MKLPLDMTIYRDRRDGDHVGSDGKTYPDRSTTVLDDAAIARDPIATAAVANVNRIVDWATAHDVPEVHDALRGAKITLTTQRLDGAWGDLWFTAPRSLTRYHLARSPEVFAHEISHRVIEAFSYVERGKGKHDLRRLELVNEGLSDIFGHVVAASSGHAPAIADFRIADELGGKVAKTGIRDLANPPWRTLSAALAAGTKSDAVRYDFGKPLSFAYTQLVGDLGLERAGELAVGAITEQLKPILAGSPASEAELAIGGIGSWKVPHEFVRQQYTWVRDAFLAAAGTDPVARAAVERRLGDAMA